MGEREKLRDVDRSGEGRIVETVGCLARGRSAVNSQCERNVWSEDGRGENCREWNRGGQRRREVGKMNEEVEI